MKRKHRNKFTKIYEFVIEKPGVATSWIVVFYTVVLFLSICAYWILLLHRKDDFYVNDVLQIINYVVCIASFNIAVVQLSNFLYHNKFDMQMRKKEKSIKVAQIYAKNILCEISFVHNVLKGHLEEDGLNSLRSIEHKLFNYEQYNKLKLSSNIKKIFNINEQELSVDLINKNKFVSKKFSGDYDDFDHIVKQDLKKEYNRRFRGVIYYTLNLLEGIAMEINDGVCDGDLLFKPLHKSYIQFVEEVSPCIYTKNTGTEEIMYSNVTKLYRRWIKKQEQNVSAVVNAYNEETNTKKIQ